MKKALAALLFLLVPGSAGYPQLPDVPVHAMAVPIDPGDPAHLQFGALRFLAGWQLTSRQGNFGGYSALAVQGDHFLALSDTGDYLGFRLSSSGEVRETHFGTLPAFPGATGGRDDRDSESMTVGPQGDIWVGFETRNAVLRYRGDLSALVSAAQPAAMKDWPRNLGAEAMARLEGGRFLIFSEGKRLGHHLLAALMFSGDPTNPRNTPFQFAYRPPARYAPTDAQQLPDGRVIVLHRHFGVLDGFWAALSIVDPREIVPGAVVSGKLIAELRPPLNIDNMEGISVVQEGGRTVIWLISDDNQVPIERTLLLKFELRPS